MVVTSYADVEDLAKDWLLSTGVADLVTHGGYAHIYLAMPKGAPNPAITLSRVGGGPSPGSDVPVDIARISFNCWGKNRNQSKESAKMLVSEADSLALTGGYTSIAIGGRLEVAEVASWLWLPDPVGDTPRYVVDLRFIVTAL